MRYASQFGILVNVTYNSRPVSPVNIWMLYPEDTSLYDIPGNAPINFSNAKPLLLDLPLEKDLEELVGQYNTPLHTSEDFADLVHYLDWTGTAFEYIPDVEPRHRMSVPMILTSNPYWVDRTVWKEISNDAFKANIRLAQASVVADIAMKVAGKVFNQVLGNH